MTRSPAVSPSTPRTKPNPLASLFGDSPPPSKRGGCEQQKRTQRQQDKVSFGCISGAASTSAPPVDQPAADSAQDVLENLATAGSGAAGNKTKKPTTTTTSLHLELSSLFKAVRRTLLDKDRKAGRRPSLDRGHDKGDLRKAFIERVEGHFAMEWSLLTYEAKSPVDKWLPEKVGRHVTTASVASQADWAVKRFSTATVACQTDPIRL
eukprot:TRINITY_DN674_c0_g1_i1.p1 TRINITY_DN674_c0_g1~~TRINITY_DN674_c0_g1_i1.p1  ORF type:complete len:208 (+),score=38.52 TRINITY_DN674_c0_g1_i1:48-671(+)